MDTIYNDVSNGPFIQTFLLVAYSIMIAVYHTNKNAKSMVNGLCYIKSLLGNALFRSIFQILLIDCGNEFSDAKGFEELVGNVFYCDTMASWQKPHVENNHRVLRYICPKEKDLYQLGLQSQTDLDLIFSHINSYPRRATWEISNQRICLLPHRCKFYLDLLHIKCIEKDSIILNPTLIKK